MRRRFELFFNFNRPAFGIGDGLIILIIAVLIYLGTRLAINAPATVIGPDISLSPGALPWYAFLSTGRMAIAYLLSLTFTLVYGYAAARNRTAEKVLMPLLDILQSVPILSFLPVVLLSLTAILPQRFATELAAVILIFTSQAWNMTYSFYQSVKTIPTELHEAASIFRFSGWLRFKTMELPFAALGLIWNSMMSWAGGWFFLMASEIFTVGSKDFRLPGLGSYLQTAANQGDVTAIFFGLGTLILVIVLLDQLMWRPILVWANKFKVEMVESDTPPESWFYDLLSRSWIMKQFANRVWHPLNEKIDRFMGRIMHIDRSTAPDRSSRRSTHAVKHAVRTVIGPLLAVAALIGLIFGGISAIGLLIQLPIADYGRIGTSLIATFLRVAFSLVIAVAWTIPVGVLIGSNQKLATFLQPVVQIVASIPATALFPVIVLALINLTGGLDVSAVILMLLGTQWYVLFNVIAGTSAIPQDLAFTTSLLQVKGWARWRTLILPALFPYLITGMITASGGAWNASIIAEHIEFSGRSISTTGVGALIAEATATGNYPLLLASTLALILTVVTINRTFWRRLYKVAEERYRME